MTIFSKNSAFKPWIRGFNELNAYNLLTELIESNEITLAKDNIVLTPFESLLLLENINVKCTYGVIKVVK